MTENTKDFSIGAVMSTYTGRLVDGKDGIGGVYAVLNWMTGESVHTHQIPRISREARPVLEAMYPDLAKAKDEAELVTGENWRDWLATWTRRYGEMIAVPKFNEDTHERIDPMSELAETVHPDKILTVRVKP